MRRKEKELRLKVLTKLIAETKKLEAFKQREATSSQKILAAYQKEFADITMSLTKVKTGITVSDHAVLRYMERKYNFDVEGMRQEILTPMNKMAIKAGATSIKVGGVRFYVRDNTITTTV